MSYNLPTGDFVTTTLNGAISSSATSMTIGTGLQIPAATGVLQLDYDSTTAVGVDNGPETIAYTAYNSATGAVTGMTRGVDGNTSGVAHANGATVQAGPSTEYLNNTDVAEIIEANAWTSFTPSWTNLTIGNAVVTAKYQRLGKTVRFRISVVWGNTTSISGSVSVSLPITALDHGGASGTHPLGVAVLVDTGTEQYDGVIKYNTTTIAVLKAKTASGTYATANTDLANNVPFVWTTSDEMHIQGFYEAA